MVFRRVKIHSYEVGLCFRDGEFRGLVEAGRHWFFDPLGKVAVEVVSRRAPFLAHDKLDLIVKSGELKAYAEVLDLKDDERALVWVDRRFAWIVGPGQCVYWTQPRQVVRRDTVHGETLDAGQGRGSDHGGHERNAGQQPPRRDQTPEQGHREPEWKPTEPDAYDGDRRR